jgi:signal transduction histidine kinase
VKLQSYTLLYLSIALLAVIGIWAVIFYVNMLDEIYDSIDDGLDNSRLLIMKKVETDTSIIHKNEFLESNYAIREIPPGEAIPKKDSYFDSALYMQNEKDFEPVRMLRTAFRAQDEKYYELTIVSSMVEEDDLISDLLYALIWLYLILLASVLLINKVLLRKIWTPFYETLNNLKNFRLGQQEVFSPSPTKVDEFNELNTAVSDLLRRSLETFNSQKQFIENASHELQTPLAISINKLELFAERNNLPDPQMKELASVIESLERLKRINKTLLLLSRIENRQFPKQAEIDFNDLVKEILITFSDMAEYRQLRINVEEKNHCVYRMNPELATILISNLVKNAITHTASGGEINLIIGDQSIVISNAGNNGALDEERIFKRFYKDSNSSHSTGLGLAIVKSIADYSNIEVRYAYSGSHAFTLIFPTRTSSLLK